MEEIIMESLKANILNEVQKLFSRKKTWVFLIIIAITSFLSAFFITAIQTKLVFIAMSSISFPLMALSIFTNIILPLFIFIAVSELFAGEVEDKTLKLVLIMPITRLKVYITKIISIGIYIIINLFVVLLISTISALFLNINLSSISNVICSYLIDVIPALILAIFASFIAQFFRSSSTALTSCIFIFIGIKVISLFLPGINNNIFTNYLNWSSLWFSGETNFLRAINIFLLMVAYGIIFFTTGYYMFDKKEV